VLIPHLAGDDKGSGPGWFTCTDGQGNKLKPLVRCKCGKTSGIGLHHVHADGTVTASYFDATAEQLAKMPDDKRLAPGCGWHVYLKLQNFDQGDFPSNK
jgi:hypothetical protein